MQSQAYHECVHSGVEVAKAGKGECYIAFIQKRFDGQLSAFVSLISQLQSIVEHDRLSLL